MPSSPTPGSSTSISRNFDADIDLRRMTTGSALPTLPQSVPRGRYISWLHWFASATACQVARPPVRIRLDRPAFGDFYFQAFNGSVFLPVAGYNYNSDWTPLLAGLSPAGMAASFAARSLSTDSYQTTCASTSAMQPKTGHESKALTHCSRAPSTQAARPSGALRQCNHKPPRPLRRNSSPIQPPRHQAEPVLPTSVCCCASNPKAPTDHLPRRAIRSRPDKLGVVGLEPM